jgi:serine/threonine protein kinase
MKDELPPGTIIGHDYRVIQTLGRGGFGITYKCEDIRLKLIVAVKEYFPEGMASRDSNSLNIIPDASSVDIFAWGRKKFLLEGTTLAAIQHKFSNEFIVKIIRFVEERETAYLAMEFIDGMQIDDFASSNKITSANQVESIFRSLCIKALKPIHDSNFYHRDIKPGNILIRHSNGEPVIIDFGAARQTAGGKSTVALLTPRYSAVEQYASQEDMDGDGGHDLCGSFTDIYSLAATFYFIIKGKPPQDAPSRILGENLDELFGDWSLSHYSDDFLKQIDWGMKPIPRDRPQTIDEWLHHAIPKSKSNKKKLSAASPLPINQKDEGDSYIPQADRIWIAALTVMILVTALGLYSDSEDVPDDKAVLVTQAKVTAPIRKIPATKIKSRSWNVSIDAAEWTSIGLLRQLSSIQKSPNGDFELKMHAGEAFRVRTEKGLAITKADARSFGEINGEVYLKSINRNPQKVRIEIIKSD